MKILLILTILACCYHLSYTKAPKQYRTAWTNAKFNGNKFIWNPKDNFQINGSLVPNIEYIQFSTVYSIKRRSIIHALHATALRLLLIIAGDVEENPGPIDSQSKSVVDQSTPTNQSNLTADQSETSSSSTSQSDSIMKCPHCPQTFAWKSNLNRHVRSKHENQKLSCDSCSFKSSRKNNLKRHMDSFHGEGSSKQPRLDIQPTANPPELSVRPKKTALKGELKTYQLSAEEDQRDLEIFLNLKLLAIEASIQQELVGRTGIKLMLNPRIEFFKPVHPEEITTNYFSHKPIQIFRGSNISQDIQTTFPSILNAVEEFTREGSGWAIQKVLGIDVHIARLGMTKGSSYTKLPKELSRKKTMINIKNDDNRCFMWSVLANLHPVAKNAERVSKYKKYENELDLAGVEFPVKIKDISNIEKRNGLAINLYGYDEEVHPLRISNETTEHWIHLLLYEGHYSLIKNLDRLLFDQRGDKGRKYFSPRCLTAKYSNQDREAHYKVCCKEEPTKIVMPEDTELKFVNYKKMLRQPLVLYADFECLTEKVEGPKRGNTEPYQKHVPCGYGLVDLVGCCGVSTIGTPTVYRGEDCVRRFFTEIAEFATEHQETLNKNEKSIEMIPSDWIIHNGNICHICKEGIQWQPQPNDEIKVRDHCHFCGKYRGPAHRRCNRDYRKNRDVVVVIHNLRKYDTHLLMQQLGGAAKLYGWGINVVAKTMEDYISFSLVHKKETEEKKSDDELGDEPDVKDHTYKINLLIASNL